MKRWNFVARASVTIITLAWALPAAAVPAAAMGAGCTDTAGTTLTRCQGVGLDLNNDPLIGSNLLCGSAECSPLHHLWLVLQGLDVSGTPEGLIWTTEITGGAGDSGGVIAFDVPPGGDPHDGISADEVLKFAFLNTEVDSVDLMVETMPSPEVANNIPSTVVVRALDTSGTVIATQIQTFVGITDGIYTPAHVQLRAHGIASLSVSVTDVAPGGVFIHAIGTDPLLLPAGLGTELTATFAQVVRALELNDLSRACRGLTTLTNQTRAQSGKQLRVAYATQIESLAALAGAGDLGGCP